MKINVVSFTTIEIMDMLEDGTLVEESYLQRRSDQWSEDSKGLLIHSMLCGYVIPYLYFSKALLGQENGRVLYRMEIVDGLQRITVVIGYINGEFPLGDDVPPITFRKQEIELAGKYFCDLPVDVQEAIKRYSFSCINLEDFTDEEIEEMFFRLNNGVALTKNQRSKAKMGRETAELISRLLAKPFFAEYCSFSPLQYRRSADQLALIQGMALLNDYKYKTISEADMFDYATSLRDGYGEENTKTLESIVDYLGKAFTKRHKNLKKINIPIVMVTAKKAIWMGVSPEEFGAWFDVFTKDRKPGDGYAKACSSGSIKRDLTTARIMIMGESFDTYCAEHNLGCTAATTDAAEATETTEAADTAVEG